MRSDLLTAVEQVRKSGGEISGTIANDAASTTAYSVTVTVADGTLTASQTFTWTVPFVAVQNPGDQLDMDGRITTRKSASPTSPAPAPYWAGSRRSIGMKE